MAANFVSVRGVLAVCLHSHTNSDTYRLLKAIRNPLTESFYFRHADERRPVLDIDERDFQ